MTSPASDIAAIKAEYEGLQGRAGPSAKVLSISPAGSWLRSGNGPLYRRYEIVVERSNGERVTRMIGVVVGPFRGGSIEELSNVGDRGSVAPKSAGQRVGQALAGVGGVALGVAMFLIFCFLPGKGGGPPWLAFRLDHPVFLLAVFLAVAGGGAAAVGGFLIKRG